MTDSRPPPPPGRPGDTLNSPAALAASLAFIDEWRTIIDAYIDRAFLKDRDYGAVTGESAAGKEFTGKPTLLKPGAEKLTLALGLRATFCADTETYDQAGRPAGLIALKCLLVNGTGEVVGEGRGAATLAEKKSINNAVKFAEKRAQVDAVLRLAGLSGRFEQEEMRRGSARPKARPAPQQEPASPLADGATAFAAVAPPPITADQDAAIRAQFRELGWTSRQVVDWLKASFGTDRLAQLSERHAGQALRQLSTMRRPTEAADAS